MTNSCTGLFNALYPHILTAPPQILEIYKGGQKKQSFLSFTSDKIHFTRYLGA